MINRRPRLASPSTRYLSADRWTKGRKGRNGGEWRREEKVRGKAAWRTRCCGQETGRRNAIGRYANEEIHSSQALRRVRAPLFWTLCLTRDLTRTRDDRECRVEEEERSWREKEREEEEEKETKRRPHGDVMRLLMRILSLQADGLWGPRGLLKPMRAAIFSFKRRA